MLIYLVLALVLVNCGGDTHSDYYEGETHAFDDYYFSKIIKRELERYSQK